jgi:hypothetical protein
MMAKVALAGALALFAGCGRSPDERIEAGRVLRALEVVRAAPNEAKRRPAEELSHITCSSPVVCGARDTCAQAYRHLALGTEAAMHVKKELDNLEREPSVDGGRIAELSTELDQAGAEIDGARESMHGCEEAASLMRRTLGI